LPFFLFLSCDRIYDFAEDLGEAKPDYARFKERFVAQGLPDGVPFVTHPSDYSISQRTAIMKAIKDGSFSFHKKAPAAQAGGGEA
jgi:hypothetical protein